MANQLSKTLIECSPLGLFILQIIFRTTLLVKNERKKPTPASLLSIFKKSYHSPANKQNWAKVHVCKNCIRKMSRKEKEWFFSFLTSIISQNSNLFCSPNTILRICMNIMSWDILGRMILVERSMTHFLRVLHNNWGWSLKQKRKLSKISIFVNVQNPLVHWTLGFSSSNFFLSTIRNP